MPSPDASLVYDASFGNSHASTTLAMKQTTTTQATITTAVYIAGFHSIHYRRTIE
jgi:hypothetical protein